MAVLPYHSQGYLRTFRNKTPFLPARFRYILGLVILVILFYIFFLAPVSTPAARNFGDKPKPLHAVHILEKESPENFDPLWEIPAGAPKSPATLLDEKHAEELKTAGFLNSDATPLGGAAPPEIAEVDDYSRPRPEELPDVVELPESKVQDDLPKPVPDASLPVPDVSQSKQADEELIDLLGLQSAKLTGSLQNDPVEEGFTGSQETVKPVSAALPVSLGTTKETPQPASTTAADSSSTSLLGSGANWDGIEYIFSFGDSWTYTAFDVFGAQPNRANPLGNPDLPVNGVTSPPEWLYFLTTTYNHSFISTYNIAKGAATIDRAIVAPHPSFSYTQTFAEQVADVFTPVYSAGALNAPQWNANNTLFSVWFGVVDIALLLDREAYNQDVIAANAASYSMTVEKLYAAGARKFLLLNVPPMSLMPGAEHKDISTQAVSEFNARLLETQKQFTAKAAADPDAEMFVFDVNGLLTSIIEKPAITPQTAKLRNTTDNCWNYNPDAFPPTIAWDRFDPACGIPFDQYFWSNPLHPTHPVHDAIAATIVRDCMSSQRQGFCT